MNDLIFSRVIGFILPRDIMERFVMFQTLQVSMDYTQSVAWMIAP